MMRSLFIASSGMQAQQMNVDVISNNLANVNTTGFKKSRVDFQSLLYQSIRKPAGAEGGFFNPTGTEIGNGVRVAGTALDFSQGIINETGNELDLCIDGSGFFMVELPDGRVGYTRAGSLRINNDGYLINANGYPLLSSQGNAGSGSALTAGGKTLKYIKPDTKENTVTIGPDGTISTEKTSGTSGGPVLELAIFANPSALESVGATTFVANEACGKLTIGKPASGGLGVLQSRFLENSNVVIVEEMVKMIIAQRAYEINSKSLTTSDEILAMTNNLKR